ncbi:putative serine racemase, Ammonia-lyase [Helianthus annuus]|nr:putative serine racemase, Ammonia-lyase [Helianthus annuus]
MEGYKYAADIDSITKAEDVIKSYVHLTPVTSPAVLNSFAGKSLFFKDEKSGNHVAALSLATKIRGIPAYVVVPNNAPICKVENIKRYGGEVIFSEPTMKSREETATKVSLERGAVIIPSSNDARIISGQGTLSLEFLEIIGENNSKSCCSTWFNCNLKYLITISHCFKNLNIVDCDDVINQITYNWPT